MKSILASLSMRQRITIAGVALAAAAMLASLVHWKKESDFRPLFTGLSQEDAGAIVQKLKETGVEYRLPESGGAVLVPSARLAELRLGMAAAGLPKTGRIGFELFDKTNFGATEFSEHVNYRRALEGELERSVVSLAEVEQARVHLTFPKESVFLEAQQPGKASVMVKLRPGARLSAQNVLAINHLVASAVEGLSADNVAVLDMQGNLLGRPRPAGGLDGPEPSEATLEYRHNIEADLLAKINSTLEPLLGAEKFRAGVSVECDFSGGEQSEETFDPARSVMLSSQRTEDGGATSSTSGVPGTPSTLPRPVSRPAGTAAGSTRVTENITYQSSRMVKKVHLPQGAVKRMSVSVLVDHAVAWERDGAGVRRVLVAPAPEKLKAIHELVAGVTGLSTERGDRLIVEALPFESTLNTEPPGGVPPAAGPAAPVRQPWWPSQLNTGQIVLFSAAGAVLIGLLAGIAVLMLRRGKKPSRQPTAPAALPAGADVPAAPGDSAALAAAPRQSIEERIQSTLAEREAQQRQADEQLLQSLQVTPVITKAGEVLAKHLRDAVKKNPDVSAHILRAWIREEDL